MRHKLRRNPARLAVCHAACNPNFEGAISNCQSIEMERGRQVRNGRAGCPRSQSILNC
jgi:hypothetical protein